MLRLSTSSPVAVPEITFATTTPEFLSSSSARVSALWKRPRSAAMNRSLVSLSVSCSEGVATVSSASCSRYSASLLSWRVGPKIAEREHWERSPESISILSLSSPLSLPLCLSDSLALSLSIPLPLCLSVSLSLSLFVTPTVARVVSERDFRMLSRRGSFPLMKSSSSMTPMTQRRSAWCTSPDWRCTRLLSSDMHSGSSHAL
mmetsp:Transcript_9433/g.38589  ORF Transcript_9433/g.38589 Transcript_9433/m.38589 type:complete len:203 (-) Transcript_9433:1181-1789(-)